MTKENLNELTKDIKENVFLKPPEGLLSTIYIKNTRRVNRMKLIIDVPEEFYETIKTTLSYRFNYLEEKVRQATPLQAELEEIKAEIDNIRDVEVTDGTVYVSSDDVYKILDNHIKELKGEQDEH